ncbi:hypothetical protein RhiirA4_454575 [Rhizophagus irregularis]|uniref:Uncharacterized protein n=1 Tax=Rhizophagus irregularis TaxID=588596 RepID=A0A2I1G358_9GLOM|nr:hypothetical protein RhiirA4_454575 [Rhizophagus irregularis]
MERRTPNELFLDERFLDYAKKNTLYDGGPTYFKLLENAQERYEKALVHLKIPYGRTNDLMMHRWFSRPCGAVIFAIFKQRTTTPFGLTHFNPYIPRAIKDKDKDGIAYDQEVSVFCYIFGS